MNAHLSLYELNQKVRQVLEDHLEETYWVVAEISELRVNQRGHCYLELVEKKEDEILAKARATIWSYTYRNLSGWFSSITGEDLRAGMNILARVSVSFHEIYGLSLNIRDIDPQYTLGERARRRQEILKKLHEDGVADMNRELSLPLVPQRLAVIASASSAGYQDFMEQLNTNPYGYRFHTDLFEAIVQGREGERSIISAMLRINERIGDYDLLILIRGGGATLDLDCFDTYGLASHVAQFPLPVITGIGHERDETIVDLVAHTRLKTPTAVAEFMIKGCRQFEERIQELYQTLTGHLEASIQDIKYRLDRHTGDIRHFIRSRMQEEVKYLEYLSKQSVNASKQKLGQLRDSLTWHRKTLKSLVEQQLLHRTRELTHLEEQIRLLDPALVLKRGYSITRKDGVVIRDTGSLEEGDIIETEFIDGKIRSKTINKHG